jgi:DNA-directed RNA polymerase subunit H (RpoH/RPB5)
MQLIQFSILGLLVLSLTIDQSFADVLVYQCKMKNGLINFTDKPCKKDEKEKSREIIKNLAMTHSVQPKPITDDPVVKKSEPKNSQTIYSIVEERSVTRYRRAWPLDYPQPIVILPYPQNSWPTYSAQPLLNPPLPFKPPLTAQPLSR